MDEIERYELEQRIVNELPHLKDGDIKEIWQMIDDIKSGLINFD